MSKLYPLQFTPVPVERVWGGDYMSRSLHPQFPVDKKIGESWELCGLEGCNSVVCNGFLEGNEINELIEVYMGDLVGDAVFQKFAAEFPLLVKILDINDYLSFQVHPSNEMALQRHHAYGKAEAWVVLHAAPDARIYLGFNRPMTAHECKKRCMNQTLPEVMNEFTPRAGDHFFIPPGTVHAAGGGLVVAEIQQVSDITYRIYDWGREFHQESAREMHLDLALEAIHWEPFVLPEPLPITEEGQIVVESPFFHIRQRVVATPVTLFNTFGSSFRLIFCTEGEIEVVANESVTLQRGGLALIPASLTQTLISPLKCLAKLLEIWVPE